MNKFTRALVASVAAGSIMFAGAGIAPVVAYAQTPASIIKTDQTGSLTIHKFSNDSTTGVAGNGAKRENTDDLGEPLEGAAFRIRQVQNIDLKTNDGWKAAQALTQGDKAPANLGEATTATTNEAGEAVFGNLPIGLYYVEEIAPAPGHANSVAPFFVTIPMTNPTDRDAWMFDIHVYPKNSKVKNVVTKTVRDQETVTAGKDIDFTVNGKLSAAEKLEKVEITDLYPADRLTYKTVTKVTLGDGTVLDPSQYEPTDTQDGDKGQAKVSFKADALALMDKLTGEQRIVHVDFQFTVKDVAATDDAVGSITNRAMVYSKGEGQDVPEPNPDNPKDPNVIPPSDPNNPDSPKPTRTYFGNVKLEKKDPANKGLPGVGFDLYRCNKVGEEVTLADRVLEHEANNLTTDAEGVLRINGLHVNDFVNGSAGTTEKNGYCLVEVESADGHSLLAEPAYFQVLKEGNDTVALTTVKLTNVEDNAGFKLPFTGGEGVTLLLIVGGLIIVIGGGYAYVMNRRKVQG